MSRAISLIGCDHLLGLRTLAEAILKATGHGLHVFHSSGTDGAAALGLLSPVVVPHLLAGIAAGGAGLLLDVVRDLAATAACRVRLVVSPSE